MPSDRSEGAWVEGDDGPERLERAKKRRAEQLKRWETRESSTKDEPHAKRKFEKTINFAPNIVLLDAAARNDLDEVAWFLENGVSPDLANEDDLTALHQSCIDGCDEMVQYLVEHGANVNACDKELWTPLHAAAACGHLSIIKYLLKNGADVMALNLDGNLPSGVVEDNEEVEKFLDKEMSKLGYDEAAVEELRLNQGKQLLDDLKDSVENGRSLDIQDEDGATAFHVAAANGWTNVIDFLLENEADFEIADNDGWQPIHAAAAWGHEAVLEILVASGADLDSQTNDSRTPLDLTDESEIIDLIEELKAIEVKYPRKGKGVRRKRSNTSNSSIKRTSIHEKNILSHADTKAERAALFIRLQNSTNSDGNSPDERGSMSRADDGERTSNGSRDENNSSGYVSEGSADAKTEEKVKENDQSEAPEKPVEEKKEMQVMGTKESGNDKNENEKKVKPDSNNIKQAVKPEPNNIKQAPVAKPPRLGSSASASRLEPKMYINLEIEPEPEPVLANSGPKTVSKTPVTVQETKNDIPKLQNKTSGPSKVLHMDKNEDERKAINAAKEQDKVSGTTTTTSLPKGPPSEKRKAPEPPGPTTNVNRSTPSEPTAKKASRSSKGGSESSNKKRCIIV